MQGFGNPEPVGISLTTLKWRLSTVKVVPETIPVRAPTTTFLMGCSGRTSLLVPSTIPALLSTALKLGPLLHSLSLRCVLGALKSICAATATSPAVTKLSRPACCDVTFGVGNN